jgi:hypothetical protein
VRRFGVSLLVFGSIVLALVVLAYAGRKTHDKRVAALAQLSSLARAIEFYRTGLGRYPSDDIVLAGGSAEHGTNEVIHYYLREHSDGEHIFGPYFGFKEEHLTDADGDGLLEYRDPWDGVYVYAHRTPAPNEIPPRFFDIASPGPDGKLGGRMVPGKGYVPATTPAGKAAEADNVTNW